jgi:hypothetical protein
MGAISPIWTEFRAIAPEKTDESGLLLCVPEQARSLTELLCLFLMYPQTPSQPA